MRYVFFMEPHKTSLFIGEILTGSASFGIMIPTSNTTLITFGEVLRVKKIVLPEVLVIRNH